MIYSYYSIIIMNKPIGLLGGTFDPIHHGHLQLALAACQELDLEQVKLIPCYRSPHKNQPIANPEDRFNMVKLAITEKPYFSVDDYEIKNQKPSYSIDTLQAMRATLGEKTPFCWIMSMDAFLKFDLWHRWQEIPKLAHLAIANRPGSEKISSPPILDLLNDRQIFNKDLLATAPAGHIILFTMPPNPISATEIRNLIRNDKDASNLVPKAVWEYICSRKLYR
jgi:nicotinate-nucleotide adenylyltransferase